MSIYILPKNIVENVRDQVPDRLHHYAFKILGAVWMKYQRDDVPLCEYSAFARQYFVEVLGTRNQKNQTAGGSASVGMRALSAIKRAGILQPWNGGEYIPPTKRAGKTIVKGVCKHYRFNPALVYGHQVAVEVTDRKKKRQKLTEIEAAARRLLEEINLPFDTPAEIRAFIDDFLQSDEMQNRMLDRIEPAAPDYRPKYAHLLTSADGDTAKLDERHYTPYLRAGLQLFAYQPKNGPTAYFLTTADRIRELKRRQLAAAFEYQLQVLNTVRQADHVATRNETNERLDSPLTNLFSRFLALATVRGDKLAGIDLSNSQFVLFAAILDACLQIIVDDPLRAAEIASNAPNAQKNRAAGSAYKHYFQEESIKHAFHAITKKTNIIYLIPEHTLLYIITYLWHITKLNDWLPTIKPYLNDHGKNDHFVRYMRRKINDQLADVRAFIDVTRSGKLYEHIAARKFFNRDLQACDDQQKQMIKTIHRDQAKQAMFALLFDKHDAHLVKPEKAVNRDVLTAVFPSVVGIVDHIKKSSVAELQRRKKENARNYSHLYDDTPQEIGNAWFSVMLQRVEAKIFIDGTLRKTMRRYWSASKHDSILCTTSDFDKVLRIVRAELDKYLGADGYQLKRQHFEMIDGRPQIREEKI